MCGCAASPPLSSSLCLNGMHARMHSVLENPPGVRWPSDLVGKLTYWVAQVVAIRRTRPLLQTPCFYKD